MSDTSTTVIVGAGFSGTLTALHILDQGGRAVLVDRSGDFGPGVAYRTRSRVHFLNVPAGNMSAWERDPQHFLRWMQQHLPSTTGGTFVSRAWYGEYLRQQVQAAATSCGGRLHLRTGAAVALSRQRFGKLGVHFADGDRVIADRVVLAQGNFPAPHVPSLENGSREHPGYIQNPWSDAGTAAIAAIRPSDAVAIVGTGLTMMDMVMHLHAREHVGPMLAISRHGLLPRPHRLPARAPVGLSPPAWTPNWNGEVKTLVRLIRQSVRESASRGVDWRDVIASLRPVTGQLWGRMDAVQRRRFLSRIRSYWEVVRHRASPEAAAAVADLVAARQLAVRAATIVSVSPVSGSQDLEVRFRPRRSQSVQWARVAHVINCLGPMTDVRQISDPLIEQMLSEGFITPDPLGLGIAVDPHGHAFSSAGVPDPALLVIGPLCKGRTWENTAVPELRRHAAEIAAACCAAAPLAATVTTTASPTTPG